MADNLKFIKLSNWKPETNLTAGITKTINWMIENKEKFNKSIYYV